MTSNTIFVYAVQEDVSDGELLDATEIDLPTKRIFPLGRLIITPNADERIPILDINAGLARHASADWGELSPGDIRQNNDALKHGGRLLSAYTSGTHTYWIITESDRSVTTILMPEDY